MTPQLAFLLNQCVICLQSNNDHSAELFLKQAIKLAPRNPDVLRFFGIIEANRQNFDSALAYFQKAHKEAPNNVFVNSNLGNVFLELKRYEEALLAYEKAISLDPNYAEAYSNKGNALQGLMRNDEAIAVYDKAISIDPHYALAYCNKGNVLQALGRFEEAISAYEQAISINPNYSQAYANKGSTFCKLKNFDAALIAFDHAISIDSQYAEAYGNKGVALYGLHRFEEALNAYDAALVINPQYAEVFGNKSRALRDAKRFEDALIPLQMAIQIDPNDADFHLDAAILHLKLLQFSSGWEEYEWRWKSANTSSPKFITSKPAWDGKKTDKKLLIWPEQGVGDKILFSSMLEEVSLLATKAIVLIDSRLLPIYRRSFPTIEFIDEKTLIPENEFDVQIPMGSLMKLLRPTLESFQKTRFPYLIGDHDRELSLIKALGCYASTKAVCGISWKSANKKLVDIKSIPILQLSPILNLEKFDFISLQYGDVVKDLRNLEENGAQKIHQIPDIDLHDDLDGTISLIKACDLIVTCSNSVAHMAGALNKKTILILPFEQGKFWYWHEVDGHSLCYPSIKVFSQSQQGRWDDVIERVRAYMENLSFE
jgi:tetratricopeptide (TPR) repeat protein